MAKRNVDLNDIRIVTYSGEATGTILDNRQNRAVLTHAAEFPGGNWIGVGAGQRARKLCGGRAFFQTEIELGTGKRRPLASGEVPTCPRCAAALTKLREQAAKAALKGKR